jgi:hypothetical protein
MRGITHETNSYRPLLDLSCWFALQLQRANSRAPAKARVATEWTDASEHGLVWN